MPEPIVITPMAQLIAGGFAIGFVAGCLVVWIKGLLDGERSIQATKGERDA